MIRRGEGGTTPFIELAKYYEHVEKDNSRALSYTRGALERLEQLSLLGRFAPAAAIEVRKREERLLRKLNATAGLQHKEE